MRALTLDTWVLVHGTGRGDNEHSEEVCSCLMNTVAEVEDGGIVLDDGHMIEAEYRDRLGFDSDGMKWVKERMENLEVEWVERTSLPDRARVELDEAHFDMNDRKFVSAAHLSREQILVAEEADYSGDVRTILGRRLDVEVVAAECGIAYLMPDERTNA